MIEAESLCYSRGCGATSTAFRYSSLHPPQPACDRHKARAGAYYVNHDAGEHTK